MHERRGAGLIHREYGRMTDGIDFNLIARSEGINYKMSYPAIMLSSSFVRDYSGTP